MYKQLINSNRKLLILSLLMLVFCCPLIIKYSPYYLQVKKLNIFIEDLNTCNSSLSQSVHNQSIDCDLAKDLLTSGIVELNSLSKEVSNFDVMKRNELLKSKLIDTISYNNSLYETTLTLLKTSDFNMLNTKFSEYSTSIELVENSYNTLNILGLKGSFPIESKTFFDNSSNFVTTVIKLSREKDVKSSQNKNFSKGFNDCLTILDTISEDLKPALDKIKEDGRSLDVLSSDIKTKRTALNSIKNKSYSISIPEEGSTIYKKLQDTLNSFELYINALQYSIISESSTSEDISNENYKESFNKYAIFTKKFEDLKKDLDIFNKNCI